MYEQTLDYFSLVPALFGYPISWKPFLFFWTYAPFYLLPISPLISLRIPTVLFGFLSLLFTRNFLRNLNLSQMQTFSILSIMITSVSFLYSGYAIHPDMMINFLLVLSLYLISKKDSNFNVFIFVGLLAFVAVFVKTVFAFLIPFLCFFYFLFYDRKKVFSHYFLVVLLLCLLGFIVHFYTLEFRSAGLGLQTYYVDVFKTHLVSDFDLNNKFLFTLTGLYSIFEGQLIWVLLSIFGFFHNYKKYPFFSIWYLLCILLILSNAGTIWYFLYVLIPISLFALSFFSRKNSDNSFIDFDKFEKVVFSLFLLCSGFLLFLYFSHYVYPAFQNQKIAGEFLASKENVLIIGDYAPGIIGHKMHSEIKSLGKPLDFGWFFNLNQSDFAKNIPIVYYNYSSEIPNTQTGSFTDVYFVNLNFKKESNLTYFRYVAFVNHENPIPNGTLLMNLSQGRKKILIYEFPQLNSSLK
jgi:hypothetical protein